jgi:hypothetical protein
MSLTTLFAGAGLLAALCGATAAETARAVTVRSNDVVAFVGGSDVASARFSGHLETLLAIQFPNVRWRNFGWEGDTVSAQPRDVGFPSLLERLKRAEVTVVFLEFGRAESLNGKEPVAKFFSACEKMVDDLMRQTPRIILVTPAPFEKGGGLLPDLSKRNPALAARVNALRTLATQRSLALVDLFAEFHGTNHSEPRLTDNGFEFTPRGHALIAAAYARQLGFGDLAARAGTVSEASAWSNPQFESLRQLVLEKNRLWFNYSRPQNWAFLGGDRTSQPSSRDHRNPNVRWFPVEMEQYVPLIRAKEFEIEEQAAKLR